MNKFYCIDCDIVFEDGNLIKKEYKDYILGSCWKYIAYCPSCEKECSEKVTPRHHKNKPAPYCETTGSCCGGGSCGCHH